MWIQQTFESALLLEQYPRSSIRIFVQILQNDGNHVAAAINAATLALADAGIPMRDLVTASSSGMLQGRCALDLSRDEENAGGAQVVAACLANAKKVLLLEVESKVPDGQFEPLYHMALTGCEAMAAELRTCLVEHATQNFSMRLSLRGGQKALT